MVQSFERGKGKKFLVSNFSAPEGAMTGREKQLRAHIKVTKKKKKQELSLRGKLLGRKKTARTRVLELPPSAVEKRKGKRPKVRHRNDND